MTRQHVITLQVIMNKAAFATAVARERIPELTGNASHASVFLYKGP